MALGGAYLPPVVVRVTADAGAFYRTIADVKATLRDLAATQTDIPIGADTAPFLRDLAALRSTAGAGGVTVPVTADIAPALAQIAALGAAGGGGGAAGAAAVAGAAAGAGGGKAGGGLLASLGWGGGLFGMAAAGSLASFAGLGFEHVATIAAGLVGSAAGGLGGAALLGLGAGGVAAVGMGSDLAVTRSMIADTQTLMQAQQSMNQAVAVYGKNSSQAAAATRQLAYDVQLLGNTAGVHAELRLATALTGLNTYWDQATSAARVAAVSVAMQGVHLAHQFIPLVAAAATKNLSAISRDLKPLFGWLESTGTAAAPGGMQIFKNVEAVFYRNLPHAMHAFNEAVRLVLRTINLVAPKTGGIMKWLDTFFTKMNSPAGWAKWTRDVSVLLAMTHTWFEFLKQVFITIIDFASLAAKLWTGAGGKGGRASILGGLTDMLKQLDVWMVGTSALGGTKHANTGLAKIFQLHKTEIIALLAAVGAIVAALGKLYLTVAPAAITIAILGIEGLTKAVGLLAAVPFGAVAVGLGLIALKFGPISAVLLALGAALGRWKVGSIDVGAITTAVAGVILFSKTLRGIVFGPIIQILRTIPIIGRLFSTGGPQAVFSGAVTRFGLWVDRLLGTGKAGIPGAAGGGAAAGTRASWLVPLAGAAAGALASWVALRVLFGQIDKPLAHAMDRFIKDIGTGHIVAAWQMSFGRDIQLVLPHIQHLGAVLAHAAGIVGTAASDLWRHLAGAAGTVASFLSHLNKVIPGLGGLEAILGRAGNAIAKFVGTLFASLASHIGHVVQGWWSTIASGARSVLGFTNAPQSLRRLASQYGPALEAAGMPASQVAGLATHRLALLRDIARIGQYNLPGTSGTLAVPKGGLFGPHAASMESQTQAFARSLLTQSGTRSGAQTIITSNPTLNFAIHGQTSNQLLHEFEQRVRQLWYELNSKQEEQLARRLVAARATGR